MISYKTNHNSKAKLALIIILILAIIFRFYNLPHWIIFGMDQENEALIMQNILRGFHFPAIGLSVGDTGLYRGPFFLYLYSIIQFLFSGNPLGGALFSSGLGVCTTFAVYYFGKKMFSRRIGIISSFLYATSFLVSFYERQFWNPSVIPLLSLFIGYFSYKILNNKVHLIPIVFFIIGMGSHAHFSILIFLPFILYICWTKRKKISRRLFILTCILFLITQSSVIFFDIRHNFLNTKTFITLFFHNVNNVTIHTSLFDRFQMFFTTIARFIAIPPFADLFVESGQCKELLGIRKNPYPEVLCLSMVGLGLFMYKVIKSSTNVSKRIHLTRYIIGIKMTALLFIISCMFLSLYDRTIFEYYFLYLLPWLAIIFGLALDFIWMKKFGNYIVYIVLTMTFIMNITTLFTSKYSFDYENKMKVIQYVKQNIGIQAHYSLEAIGDCPRFGGYRYLFEQFFTIPTTSYMDSYFDWLYSDKLVKSKPDYVVLLSMIDPREENKTNIMKFQEEKMNFLANYSKVSQKQIENVQVYILRASF
jgi:4-amino-4-deoxy-L-arabinose transferase-like glycosyltransferase